MNYSRCKIEKENIKKLKLIMQTRIANRALHDLYTFKSRSSSYF